MNPEYVARLRNLEKFFLKGGMVDDAAVKFNVSGKTIRRMMDCLRKEGAILTETSKGFWKCSKGIFKK
jgi:transposase